MAYGVELVFGFPHSKWHIIEEALGFKIPRPIEGDPHGFDQYEPGYFDDLTEDQALKEYWSELWGKEFASALTFDHLPDGDRVDVEASGIQEVTVKTASE